VPGRSPLGHQVLDDGDDLIGVAGSSHPHGQGLSGVLVDDVQQLQPLAVGVQPDVSLRVRLEVSPDVDLDV
jgi:hypothetical protein